VKTNRKALAALSIFAAGSLALTACGGGSGDSGKSSSAGSESGAATSNAIITTNGNEPQNPIIPTNTTEVGGGKIADLIFAGLVSFDAKGAVQMDQAESITPNETSTLWTVKLKSGLKFTDGTPVTSDSFIKAWNYGADIANAQGASYFFDNIKGYSADEKKPVSEMEGLKKVSDTEFTVELINPEADFTKRLGYTAFVPLPEAAFKDIKAFGENPIGNGPYKFEKEGAWVHNEGVTLVKNADYQGSRTAKNGGVKITFYAEQSAAYADAQSDNLDVLDQVPDANFANYETDFPERSVNQAAAIFQSFTIPQYLEHFKPGKEGELRRKAISMAVDRDSIIKAVFNGTRTAAKDFTSPVIEGWNDKLEGADVLSFNAEQAKKLWAEADAISKYDGTFTIAYNTDGGHATWVEAATNSIAETLGIKAEGKAYPAFKQLLDDEDKDAMTGAFRSGWQADYPSMYNFLAPLYQTGAGSNYGRYASAEFDGLLKEGAAAKSVDEATGKFEDAQKVLLKDLPAIPLWYSNVNGVWSNKVQNVEFGWNSVPLYYNITKAE